MAVDFSSLGMLFILFAWVVELYHSLRSGESMRSAFLIFYAVGVAIIVTGDFSGGSLISGIMNLGVLVIAFMLLINMAMTETRASSAAKPQKRGKK